MGVHRIGVVNNKKVSIFSGIFCVWSSELYNLPEYAGFQNVLFFYISCGIAQKTVNTIRFFLQHRWQELNYSKLS